MTLIILRWLSSPRRVRQKKCTWWIRCPLDKEYVSCVENLAPEIKFLLCHSIKKIPNYFAVNKVRQNMERNSINVKLDPGTWLTLLQDVLRILSENFKSLSRQKFFLSGCELSLIRLDNFGRCTRCIVLKEYN